MNLHGGGIKYGSESVMLKGMDSQCSTTRIKPKEEPQLDSSMFGME
jgi:hypothetical protein